MASTAGRVVRPNSGAYSATKFALAGWSDALYAEERAHGVHVGLVLPGFVKTEGFPARSCCQGRDPVIVSEPERRGRGDLRGGPGRPAERYVPRYYWFSPPLRIVAPRLVRRAIATGAFNTSTNAGE